MNFSLVVDSFGVKYVGKQHGEHLVTCIQKYYPVSVDWSGELYCGVSLDWDYKQKFVNLYMSGYVEVAMHEYQHKIHTRLHCAPQKWERPYYGVNSW